MKMRIVRSALLPAVFLAMAFLLTPNAYAQTTLGGITGTVTDSSGAVISGATVTLVGDRDEAEPHTDHQQHRLLQLS